MPTGPGSRPIFSCSHPSSALVGRQIKFVGGERFTEGLGFGVDERWEDKGVLLGVMMTAGDAQIGLSQDDWKKGRDRLKGAGMRIYISTVQDIDQLAAHAKQSGVVLDSEPHDTEWGTRVFDVTEPSGFKLTISSQV